MVKRVSAPTSVRRLAALSLLALVTTACTTSTPTVTPATLPTAATGGTASSAPASTATSARATNPTTTPVSATPGAAAGFRVEVLASGLDTPWELVFAPDGRAFVTERPGRLRVFEQGQLRADSVATVPDVVEQGEGGLLGLALDPDFANNGEIYLYHTYSAGGGGVKNRVIRYILQDRAGARGLADPRVIIDNIPCGSIHNGGRIAFGPDGKLYVTTGDAGSGDSAQDLTSLGGKILRLNPDGSVPGDNPFPNSPVYSYGHRNPQGLAWQPGTNQLYATEHGPSAHDEVNRIVPGSNYGWPTAQGNDGQREGFVPPVLESGANNTWAPSGATFVRGDTFPQWRGSLLFAGLRSTTLWQLTLAASGVPRLTPVLQDDYGRLRLIREGPDGLLYALTSNQDGRGSPTGADDRIIRLVPVR
jgi:glucose/arabinose dehydrogenase